MWGRVVRGLMLAICLLAQPLITSPLTTGASAMTSSPLSPQPSAPQPLSPSALNPQHSVPQPLSSGLERHLHSTHSPKLVKSGGLRLRGGADAAIIGAKRRMDQSGEGSLPPLEAEEATAAGEQDLHKMGGMEGSGSEGGGGGGEENPRAGMTVRGGEAQSVSVSSMERGENGESTIGVGNPQLLQRVLELAQKSHEAKKSKSEEKELSADAKAELEEIRHKLENEMDDVVEKFKGRLLKLLDWRKQSRHSEDSKPPEHARGGFACVLLDKELRVAYRLEPMRNQVDAAAWLAFHVVLEMFGTRAAASVAVDKPGAVMTADRVMATSSPHECWNDTSIVRCYQEPTLAAFSRHVVKHRNRLLRKGSSHNGGLIVAGEESGRGQSRLLTPRLWFWHRIEMPVLPESENGTITENDKVRRVRGRELADVLCGQEGGGERKGNPEGETRSVRLLCTVFDLGTTDLASVSRSSWQGGAPEDVPVKVVHDIGLALRCMHACGVAHGDVKMANILRIGDGYWLGDLPALTRATTKMLTNDPLCSTTLITGKRMLSNDMWGLGLITISLLAGSAPFKRTCDKFKKILPPQSSGPLWVIFAAGVMHTLSHLVPGERILFETARSLRQLIQAPVGRKMIRPISRESRETCRAEGENAARQLLKHKAAPKLWTQIAYCLDVSNVARNALAMPLPGEEGMSDDDFEEGRADE